MKKPKYDFSKENPYNTFGKNQFLNANTGETVIKFIVDLRTLLEKEEGSFSNVSPIEEDSIWNKYLKYLPEYMILDYLTKEQWGEDEDLIEKYYKKPYAVNKINISSLPEETLKFLVNRYYNENTY